MPHVKVDLSQFDELSKVLTKVAPKGVAYAARNALNSAAFEGRKAWTARAASDLTLRNSFTTRSMRVEKATGSKVASMQSHLGSVTDYMGIQEGGGSESGKTGNKPIPTSAAAGQGQKKRPRTKQVQTKNWMQALKVAAKPMGSNRRYRNMLAIAAAAAGNGIAFLELRNNRRGLFRVVGRKRGLKITMLWDLSRPEVHLKGTHTLEHALTDAAPKIQKVTREAVFEQVRRAVMHFRRR